MMSPDIPIPHGIDPNDVKAWQALSARCWIVVGLMLELPLPQLHAISQRAETEGPLRHPEIWRANAKAIMEDHEMIRALDTARRDILTTSPALDGIAAVIDRTATANRAKLEAAFRDLFSRRELRDIPPAAILSAFVRYIARLAPQLKTP